MSEISAGSNGRVFISYSRKDKPFVEKLNDALDAAGVKARVDGKVERIPQSDRGTNVSFSQDGAQLFTVSRKVVRIWDISSIRLVPQDQLNDFACSHLISNLSKNAWTVFFEDEEYRPICPNLAEPEFLGLNN